MFPAGNAFELLSNPSSLPCTVCHLRGPILYLSFHRKLSEPVVYALWRKKDLGGESAASDASLLFLLLRFLSRPAAHVKRLCRLLQILVTISAGVPGELVDTLLPELSAESCLHPRSYSAETVHKYLYTAAQSQVLYYELCQRRQPVSTNPPSFIAGKSPFIAFEDSKCLQCRERTRQSRIDSPNEAIKCVD